MDRRTFLQTTAVAAAAYALPTRAGAQSPKLQRIQKEIEKRHEEGVQRLQAWIRQPSIAAEGKGFAEGSALMMKMLQEAGFQKVAKIPTDGQPGVLGVLDAGARRTLGIYFMYDVKQVDPAEWSSPPFDAALVDKPGLGKVLMGRGAVNQKGPQAAFLAALHALRGAGQKLPVNLVLIAEGEEEIGSPHFAQLVRSQEVLAALSKCSAGVVMPGAAQDLNGEVQVVLGGKGVVELELICSGERWGRGPKHDIHSGNKPRVDSPAWRLVQALHTLVTADGQEPAIDGFADKARPLTAAQKALIAEMARRTSEADAKKLLAVDRWLGDATWPEALERMASRPTVNIEGLVAGYTGPGGKTVLPAKATAKMDLRLVPDMTFDGAVFALKAHLHKRGFGDLAVKVTGGYDATTTAADSPLVKAEVAVYRRSGREPLLVPRMGGSWPGHVFTSEPLKLPAGHFGLGFGSGAHAPDEYFVIDSANPKIAGFDGAVRSHVDFLYEIASAA